MPVQSTRTVIVYDTSRTSGALYDGTRTSG